jgi:hypothetical protein
LPRFGVQLGVVLLGLLAVSQVHSQDAHLQDAQSQNAQSQNAKSQNAKSDAAPPKMTPPPEAALVNSVRVLYEQNAPAVEVISSHQVVPSIEFLDSPPRLVIDLLNARMGLQRKRVPVLQENILTIRTEQFQNDPPIVRIVVDLLVPYRYTWDIAGNRLMVRLKALNVPNQTANAAGNKSPFQPPQALSSSPSATPAIAPVPLAGGIGEVALSDKRLAAGSSLTAGPDTAVLRLSRGGEIRVCPGTTISVTPSKNSRDLMLGMNTGSLETHYALDASADSVLTPDFRILFAGPGEFDYAISADSHGNTCVRGLAGNSSSVVVSELMGDRVYQVKPTEPVVFHNGRIDKVDTDVPPDCGCPAPVPVMRAAAPAAGVEASPNPNVAGTVASSLAEAQPQTLSNGPETRPLPPSQPGDIQVQVDAPIVFRGRKNSAAQPAPVVEVAQLPVMESSARPFWLELQAQPPPAPTPGTAGQSEHHGLMHKIKGFFASMFH